MSSIKDLDTLSLRKLYYLLSIDLRSLLLGGLSDTKYDSKTVAQYICHKAFDAFSIELDEDEIRTLFIQPLADYLEPLSTTSSIQVNGEYALSIYHLEFRSSLALFLAGLAK
jgi:transcriptional antiterminator